MKMYTLQNGESKIIPSSTGEWYVTKEMFEIRDGIMYYIMGPNPWDEIVFDGYSSRLGKFRNITAGDGKYSWMQIKGYDLVYDETKNEMHFVKT